MFAAAINALCSGAAGAVAKETIKTGVKIAVATLATAGAGYGGYRGYKAHKAKKAKADEGGDTATATADPKETPSSSPTDEAMEQGNALARRMFSTALNAVQMNNPLAIDILAGACNAELNVTETNFAGKKVVIMLKFDKNPDGVTDALQKLVESDDLEGKGPEDLGISL